MHRQIGSTQLGHGGHGVHLDCSHIDQDCCRRQARLKPGQDRIICADRHGQYDRITLTNLGKIVPMMGDHNRSIRQKAFGQRMQKSAELAVAQYTNGQIMAQA